jgi:PST family polysaccharide transporter
MPRRPDSDARDLERDARFDTGHLKRDIARRTVRGGAVTLSAQLVKVIAQFATIALLARLLSPDDFGVFAVVAAILLILELFKDLGLSSATVQRSQISDRQVSTLFWLNVMLGLLVAGLMSLLAPVLASLYGEPSLADLAPAVSLTLVLTGFAAQHLALLRRQMRFSVLAGIQTGAELTAMSAAIVAAFAGMGIWSLVVQRLVWGAVIASGAWAATRWFPGRPGRYSEVRSLIAFGGNATAAMVLGRVAESYKQLLIGWYWGAVPLGLFERSQRLIMMPIRNINMPLAAVALPMLSRLADRPEAYRRGYISITGWVAMAIAPGAALIVAGAGSVTELVLGPQWAAAAPILGWLGVSALYTPVTYTLSWLYMSQDRTNEMLRAAATNAVVSIVAVTAALPFGAVAVAASFSLSGAFIRTPILVWLVCRQGPLSWKDFARIFSLPVLGAGAAAASIHLLADLPAIASWPVAALVAAYAAAAVLAALVTYTVVPSGRRALAESLQIPRMIRPRSVDA